MGPSRSLLRASMALVAAAIAAGAFADAAGATYAGKNGRLAFGFAAGIATVNANGSSFRVILRGQPAEAFPIWSPLGTRLLFTRLGGQTGLYSVRADGAGLRRLTTSASFSFEWAPDGQAVAFVDAGSAYVLDLRTGASTEIFHGASPAFANAVTWAPDGGRLAVSVSDDSHPDGETIIGRLFVVGRDGTGLTEIVTRDTTFGFDDPRWSPNGADIAFIEPGSFGLSTLIVVKPDGTRLRTPGDCCPGDPHWAPRGNLLLFEYLIGIDAENPDIYVVRPDGTGFRPLVRSRGYNSTPAWSPDGNRVAFASNRHGRHEVYVKKLQGGTVRVTRNRGFEDEPDWQARCSPKGTAAGNTLVGGIGPDFLCGLEGDDSLNGGRGGDRVLGGPGDDQLVGDRGVDVLVGGPGVDRLAGGANRDLLNARDGFGGDTVVGDSGDLCLVDPGDIVTGCTPVT